MPNSSGSLEKKVSQADTDAFVAKVIGWSQTLQACADAGVRRAREQYDAGEISFSAYDTALEQKIAVTQSCLAMTNAASGVLLVVAEGELAPLRQATAKLAEASARLNQIKDGVIVVSELVVAAGALAAAITGPGVASIGAAAAALEAAASKLGAKDTPAT